MKLVQPCLSAGNVRQSRRFNHVGGPVMLVQASLSARRDLESGFHHCGGPVKLVLASLMCQERSRKQFSPPWRSCEALAGLSVFTTMEVL